MVEINNLGKIHKLLGENEITGINFYCGPPITLNKVFNPP